MNDFVIFWIVFCFVLADIVTGFLRAKYRGEIDSSRLREGLFHKLGEILITIFCWALEFVAVYIGSNATFAAPYLTTGVSGIFVFVVTYICLMETVSVLENICEFSPGLKNLFAPWLAKLKEKQTEMEGEDDGARKADPDSKS